MSPTPRRRRLAQAAVLCCAQCTGLLFQPGPTTPSTFRAAWHPGMSFSPPPARCTGASALRAAASVGELQEGDTYWELVSRRLEKARRPSVVTVPRQRLYLDFAVLLMRSSYQVADELDYTPMDAFQREFFLFRQGEWEGYKQAHQGIQQGDLRDPNYFDFISFAQYATISNGMRKGQQIFTEKVGAEGETQTVQRDPTYSDNSILPIEHSRRVGDRILAYLRETYPKVAPQVPAEAGGRVPLGFLAEDISRIANLFRLNFFMLEGNVTTDEAKRTITLQVSAPANLWGQQVLALRRDQPGNAFEAKAVEAYLRACGLEGVQTTTRFRGFAIEHTFQLPPALVA